MYLPMARPKGSTETFEDPHRHSLVEVDAPYWELPQHKTCCVQSSNRPVKPSRSGTLAIQKGERKRIVTELTLAPEQRKDRRKRTRVERLRRRLDLRGRPQSLELFLDAFRKRKTKCFQLEETNTNVGKRDACIRLCGSFRSDGKDARIHIHIRVTNAQCVCVCAWGLPKVIVTWLILPVVICLSQRLSHACLSISNFVL